MLAVIQNLIKPKGKIFYTCFLEAAHTIEEMAVLLHQMAKTTNYELRIQKAQEIELLENKNDELTHKVFVDLHSIFLTPITREDICDLTGLLDDVADYIFASSKSILPVKMQNLRTHELHMTQCILSMSKSIIKIMDLLDKSQDFLILQEIEIIKSIEKEVDELYDQGMKYLYQKENDFKDFMRSREVLLSLENTAKAAGKVANCLDNIVLKHMA